MYQAFYHLTRKPFSLVPDPDFLYLSKKHAVALSFLELSFMDETGISLITGDVGAGKTTIIRKALENIGDDITIGVITNTHKNFGDLLIWVLVSFDLKPAGTKAEQYQQLVDFIASEFSNDRRVVLIVDEAQNMSEETLEELRLLSNINMGDKILWQLILVGQPELKELLMKPELRQFAQRISLEYHLSVLDYIETVEYIKHRMNVAGCEKNIFHAVADAMIYYHSRGIPRIINSICELALITGFGLGEKIITAQIISDVLKIRVVSQHQLAHIAVPGDAKKLQESIYAKTGYDISLSE